jgi:hypothetical protein
MIKDFLLRSLPERLAPPAQPRDRNLDRQKRRVLLILCVMLLLSGWFVPAWISLIAVVVLASAWMWVWAVGKDVVALIRDIGSSVRPSVEEPKPGLVERIGNPLIDQADPNRRAIPFDPHLPFQSPEDGIAWAIDPLRRAIRVMAAASRDVDLVMEWDDPIRAVELQQVKIPRWLPMLGNTLPIIRGDRDLKVTSGIGPTNEWHYVFRFSGFDKETARRWRDVFEGWMKTDRERGSAVTLSH